MIDAINGYRTQTTVRCDQSKMFERNHEMNKKKNVSEAETRDVEQCFLVSCQEDFGLPQPIGKLPRRKELEMF